MNTFKFTPKYIKIQFSIFHIVSVYSHRLTQWINVYHTASNVVVFLSTQKNTNIKRWTNIIQCHLNLILSRAATGFRKIHIQFYFVNFFLKLDFNLLFCKSYLNHSNKSTCTSKPQREILVAFNVYISMKKKFNRFSQLHIFCVYSL